jgi:hypothetical protein
MKIKIETKKTTVTYKEIELPYYTKSSCHFYKVYSADNTICVTDLGGHESIGIYNSSLALEHSNNKSNEKEFKKAFDKITKILESKI